MGVVREASRSTNHGSKASGYTNYVREDVKEETRGEEQNKAKAKRGDRKEGIGDYYQDETEDTNDKNHGILQATRNVKGCKGPVINNKKENPDKNSDTTSAGTKVISKVSGYTDYVREAKASNNDISKATGTTNSTREVWGFTNLVREARGYTSGVREGAGKESQEEQSTNEDGDRREQGQGDKATNSRGEGGHVYLLADPRLVEAHDDSTKVQITGAERSAPIRRLNANHMYPQHTKVCRPPGSAMDERGTKNKRGSVTYPGRRTPDGRGEENKTQSDGVTKANSRMGDATYTDRKEEDHTEDNENKARTGGHVTKTQLNSGTGSGHETQIRGEHKDGKYKTRDRQKGKCVQTRPRRKYEEQVGTSTQSRPPEKFL